MEGLGTSLRFYYSIEVTAFQKWYYVRSILSKKPKDLVRGIFSVVVDRSFLLNFMLGNVGEFRL